MFYVLDENHNLIEAYDKEGVLAVLSQAIANGSLSGISADAGFVSKLKCCVGGATHPIAFVTQAKYNELQASGNLINDCIYYITDDTSADDMNKALEELTEFKEYAMKGNLQSASAKVLSRVDSIEQGSNEQVAKVEKAGIYAVVCDYELYPEEDSCTDIIIIPDLLKRWKSINEKFRFREDKGGVEQNWTGFDDAWTIKSLTLYPILLF